MGWFRHGDSFMAYTRSPMRKGRHRVDDTIEVMNIFLVFF